VDSTALNVLTIIIGSGGIVGGIVALFKMRPETSRIVVSAAEGAVIVQSGVITSLKNEIQRLHEDHELCQDEVQELRDLLDLINERKIQRRKLPILPEEAPDHEPHSGGENGVD
jgi:hypothetical protein